MFLENRTVWHVYNSKLSGRVLRSDNETTTVLWSDGRSLIHPTKFIRDDFGKCSESGPSCDAVSGSSKGKSAAVWRKDPPTGYKAEEHDADDPKELEITFAREEENESTFAVETNSETTDGTSSDAEEVTESFAGQSGEENFTNESHYLSVV